MQDVDSASRTAVEMRYNGRDLREMFFSAANWLERSVYDINSLNVFPVPDGDCGTNMLLTLRSTTEETYRAPDCNTSGVAHAMARGALMGARGNSGVILSQIFRGMAQKLDGKESFVGSDFAAALVEGAQIAYKALSHPVEGTILTVVRDASQAAQKASEQSEDLCLIMEATVEAARDSVADTPNLLPVLRHAGVVDAGGQGLLVILEGVLRHLNGEAESMPDKKADIVAGNGVLVAGAPRLSMDTEEPYGYCTEFLLKGRERLNKEEVQDRLSSRGRCLIVVGEEDMVHVHIHTFDPGKVLQYATSLGTLHEIKIENMDDQYRQFTEAVRAEAPVARVGTVAVVQGDGLAKLFQSLGIGILVSGGQTMNPSTGELVAAVESVPQDKVIILPNNVNIVPAAKQVKSLTSKKVRVVPTVSIPQGIAALLSFGFDADLAANASAMKESSLAVKTIELTRAVRTARIDKVQIKAGQIMGFIDGKLASVAESPEEAFDLALNELDLAGSELITLYYGNGVSKSDAGSMADRIRQSCPSMEVELIHGGQPHYMYIASIE